MCYVAVAKALALAMLVGLLAGCSRGKGEGESSQANPCGFLNDLGPAVGFEQHLVIGPTQGEPRAFANNTLDGLNVSIVPGSDTGALGRIVQVGWLGLHRSSVDWSVLLIHVTVQDTDVGGFTPRLDVQPQLDWGADQVKVCFEFQRGTPTLDDITYHLVDAKTDPQT